MTTYGVAKSDKDLFEILALQKANLPANISFKEANSEGFVTVNHNFDLLKKMNSPFPHIIATSENKVIGYTLVMLRQLENEIPILVPMFKQINSIEFGNVLLQNASYFIMGQVCIDKKSRGKGIFKGLYEEMKKRMRADFDYIITEISTRNHRSIRAHEKVGFETIKEYESDGKEWKIVLMPTK